MTPKSRHFTVRDQDDEIRNGLEEIAVFEGNKTGKLVTRTDVLRELIANRLFEIRNSKKK